jgi:hypothetical protein
MKSRPGTLPARGTTSASSIVVVPVRARVFAIASLAGALLAFAAQPGAAGAFSKAIWGEAYHDGVNQFPLYHKLGVSIYETDLIWSNVAPTRPRNATNPSDPAYEWPSGITQAMQLAAQFHIRVLLQIDDAPPWANGGKPAIWAPLHDSDFANFATAAARRYPSVHLWMIGGEPNRRANFEPETSAFPGTRLDRAQQLAPHNYARMLDAAYGALKRVSRRNLVIGGSTYTTGDIDTQQWIENLRLPDGRAPRMDMYAHNPFSYTAPSFSAPPSATGQVQFSDLPRLGRWIDRYLHKGMPIFLSEWTIPTAPDQEFRFWVDPKVAAQWITDAMRLARGWRRIYGLGWIYVYDQPPVTFGGLLSAGGVPKPGFAAFENG